MTLEEAFMDASCGTAGSTTTKRIRPWVVEVAAAVVADGLAVEHDDSNRTEHDLEAEENMDGVLGDFFALLLVANQGRLRLAEDTSLLLLEDFFRTEEDDEDPGFRAPSVFSGVLKGSRLLPLPGVVAVLEVLMGVLDVEPYDAGVDAGVEIVGDLPLAGVW